MIFGSLFSSFINDKWSGPHVETYSISLLYFHMTPEIGSLHKDYWKMVFLHTDPQ